MAATLQRGGQIADGSIQRVDLDVTTVGQAVIRKAIAGLGVSLTSTGADAGTGDVTVNLKSTAIFGAATLTNNTVATTETVVAKWAVPALSVSSLDNLGVALAAQVSSTATLTFRIRFGTAGTTADALLCTFTAGAAGVANAYHYLNAIVSFLSATTATATGMSIVSSSIVGIVSGVFAPATVNLSVPNFLSITLVQSGAQTYSVRAASLNL
jgi:hypothetical protein